MWCGDVPQGEASNLDREGWSGDVSHYLGRREMYSADSDCEGFGYFGG